LQRSKVEQGFRWVSIFAGCQSPCVCSNA